MIAAHIATAAHIASRAKHSVQPMSREEKRVIFASSLGTVFEWYDFYLYGSLAATVGAQFFSGVNETARLQPHQRHRHRLPRSRVSDRSIKKPKEGLRQ
jgi:hypothetical protein